MKSLFFWKKDKQQEKTDAVSDFLLYASNEEKHRLFMKAAQQANKDQQDLVKQSEKLQAV